MSDYVMLRRWNWQSPFSLTDQLYIEELGVKGEQLYVSYVFEGQYDCSTLERLRGKIRNHYHLHALQNWLIRMSREHVVDGPVLLKNALKCKNW
jgi:hypothetical protein